MEGQSLLPAASLPAIAVVVPNFNGRHLLQACLEALARQELQPAEIVVVDNGSSDGSAAHVESNFPEVRLVRFEVNRGFAAAVNAGIRATAAPLIATLNNDTIAEPTWLRQLALGLLANPTAGMAASQMLFVYPANVINSAGICVDHAGIAWDRLGGQLAASGSHEPSEVFGACAGAALYRRSMLDEIGLFDEEFFAYLEDVDLAWRARAAGWSAVYVPAARVAHWHSATMIEGSPFKSYLLGRNKVWLIAKNYPTPHLWFYLPVIILYDLAATVYGIFTRRDLSLVRGRLAGLRGLGGALRKRRAARSLRRVSASKIIQSMAALSWPWKVSRRYAHLRPPRGQLNLTQNH
jgi:GT2 family glycosyltransferase